MDPASRKHTTNSQRTLLFLHTFATQPLTPSSSSGSLYGLPGIPVRVPAVALKPTAVDLWPFLIFAPYFRLPRPIISTFNCRLSAAFALYITTSGSNAEPPPGQQNICTCTWKARDDRIKEISLGTPFGHSRRKRTQSPSQNHRRHRYSRSKGGSFYIMNDVATIKFPIHVEHLLHRSIPSLSLYKGLALNLLASELRLVAVMFNY